MLSRCRPSPDVRRPAFSAPYVLCGRRAELEFRAGGTGGAAEDLACFGAEFVDSADASFDSVDSAVLDLGRA